MKTIIKSAKSLIFRRAYRPRQEKPKKGKGAYQRRSKHRNSRFDSGSGVCLWPALPA